MRGVLVALVWTGIGCTSKTTSDSATTADTSTTPTNLAKVCDVGAAAPRAFDTSAGGHRWGELAGDFTLTELDGSTWTLSEEWTGCDSYVFVNYFETSEGDALFASDVSELMREAPSNVHFFFTSDERGRAARRGRLEDLAERFDLGPARAERVHFVTERLSLIDGSVGAMISDFQAYQPKSGVDIGADRGVVRAPNPSFFGIDREQRWDSGGSTNNFVGGTPQIAMASYLPQFYNHKAELAHRFSQETVTEVVLLDETVTDRIFTVTQELPADLSGFDTLEMDVLVDCKERNALACSEWDRIARVDLCLDGEKCTDRRELVRWITPYWRAGLRRWGIDASPLLGLLSPGSNTFRIEMGPSWERATQRDVRIAARLSSQGGPRATGAERVFGGGTFDGSYNKNHLPVSFVPPASATRAELVVILSGHGQTQNGNCAEWCDHRHQFSINGNDLEQIVPDSGIGSMGCAPYASQGVPPGQYGNWAPLRAYWCPGLPVEAMRFDITEHVTFGAKNEVAYTASYEDRFGPTTPPGGSISLSTYVAWFE